MLSNIQSEWHDLWTSQSLRASQLQRNSSMLLHNKSFYIDSRSYILPQSISGGLSISYVAASRDQTPYHYCGQTNHFNWKVIHLCKDVCQGASHQIARRDLISKSDTIAFKGCALPDKESQILQCASSSVFIYCRK